ncbi:hypothetical protein [Ottowia thiooxydans]|uniref:Uncharacterized protein n=1 Tax=Ottowia thiooxydans TaxID=219182 RepID=A0ABV2Q8A7_9BURK
MQFTGYLFNVKMRPASAVIGRSKRVDVANATLINVIASDTHTFDYGDTHLKTIIHAAGPLCSLVGTRRKDRYHRPASVFMPSVGCIYSKTLETSCHTSPLANLPLMTLANRIVALSV